MSLTCVIGRRFLWAFTLNTVAMTIHPNVARWFVSAMNLAGLYKQRTRNPKIRGDVFSPAEQ